MASIAYQFLVFFSFREIRDLLYLHWVTDWDDRLTISQLQNRTLQSELRRTKHTWKLLWKWVLTGKRTCAGMNWWNLFSSGISTDGATKALVRLLQRNSEKTQVKTLEGRELMVGKCIWTDNPSTPGLIIAFLESMDQPESPSEARLHWRNFPSNLSEVANAKTTTMPLNHKWYIHTGAVSSVWREPKRSWTTSMLLRLACLSGLTSKWRCSLRAILIGHHQHQKAFYLG